MGILQARILEWVTRPSSRGSSQPRDQNQVSSTAGRFFTVWATREDQEYWSWPQELNRGLLLLRWILYQLSYQGRVNESRSVMSDSLKPHGLYNPGNLQAKILGSRSLLQGIFPTQELNRGLLQLQPDSLPAELPGCVCVCKLDLRRLEGIIVVLQRRSVNRTWCSLGIFCASAVHWAYVRIEHCGYCSWGIGF